MLLTDFYLFLRIFKNFRDGAASPKNIIVMGGITHILFIEFKDFFGDDSQILDTDICYNKVIKNNNFYINPHLNSYTAIEDLDDIIVNMST